MRFCIALLAAFTFVSVSATAQSTPLTRADAVRTAMERGARLGVATADTAVASAALLAASARPNPSASASYSAAYPNFHVALDLPVDLPGVRNLRVGSAQLAVRAAQYRYRLARATIALDADTTYTRAVAARERVALSQRNALDADSLLRIAERRRDAGDAAEMDVELARVNAGQQANIAAADSLAWLSALLDLQAVLGMSGQQPRVRAVDSLTSPPDAAAPPNATLAEAAANGALESAALATRLQRRSVWSAFSVSAGLEYRDPLGQAGLLPTVGIGLGLPLFTRNRGPIAQAQAEQARAAADLALATIDARNAIAHAVRERENAMVRIARDRALVASAEHLVAMSLTAYREGASTLANVLAAQRSARDVLSQYIDDLAAAWIATAELRTLATPISEGGVP